MVSLRTLKVPRVRAMDDATTQYGPVNKYVALSECVFEIIRRAQPNKGDKFIDLLRNRRRSWSIYADSPEWIEKVYKDRAALYVEALEAEIKAETLLCQFVKTGSVHGYGSDADGSRRIVNGDDWSTCHIKIDENVLLAPLSFRPYRSLRAVQINLHDVLVLLEKDMPANDGEAASSAPLSTSSLPFDKPPLSTRLTMAHKGAKKSIEVRQKKAGERRQWLASEAEALQLSHTNKLYSTDSLAEALQRLEWPDGIEKIKHSSIATDLRALEKAGSIKIRRKTS